MPSAALTSHLPRNQRFHQPWWRGRVVLGLFWQGIAAGHIVLGHGPYHVLEGVFWSCFGIFYCATGLTVWWELRPEGLLQRNFWTTQLIPYTDITKIEQRDDLTRPIDVQYFTTSPSTFPRKTMIVGITDREQFIDSLLELAPTAEFHT